MSKVDYSSFAAAWVNLLVPGKFAEAEKLISDECVYNYKNEALRGPSIVNAFVESHHNAEQQLDCVEYLPGVATQTGPDGVLVAVADKLSLNGKIHVYNDRLLVRMEMIGMDWQVLEVQHRPMQEERDKLKMFFETAGPKRI